MKTNACTLNKREKKACCMYSLLRKAYVSTHWDTKPTVLARGATLLKITVVQLLLSLDPWRDKSLVAMITENTQASDALSETSLRWSHTQRVIFSRRLISLHRASAPMNYAHPLTQLEGGCVRRVFHTPYALRENPSKRKKAATQFQVGWNIKTGPLILKNGKHTRLI